MWDKATRQLNTSEKGAKTKRRRPIKVSCVGKICGVGNAHADGELPFAVGVMVIKGRKR